MSRVQRALDAVNRFMPRVALNTLQPAVPKKKKQRVGRGIGSGRGLASGRGNRGGWGKRHGKARAGFTGGEVQFWRALPKHGFRTKLPDLHTVNLGKLQQWIDTRRIDARGTIDMYALNKSGICGRIKYGVKLLGDGKERFTHKINIEVSQASTSAIASIEALGGTVKAVYYNRLSLRALLKPHKFVQLPHKAAPLIRRHRLYYSDPEKRGYLASDEEIAEARARLAEEVRASRMAAVDKDRTLPPSNQDV